MSTIKRLKKKRRIFCKLRGFHTAPVASWYKRKRRCAVCFILLIEYHKDAPGPFMAPYEVGGDGVVAKYEV